MIKLSASNSLDEWLAWLETLHPKAIELGLDRISKVAERLGLIQNLKKTDTKIITIAGTNGKGTCVAALQALLLAANKSVGAYTSPHLLKYNERIAINGVFASDQEIVDVFYQIDKARAEISLSYFEFGTLAALLLFLNAGVEFWVLEVGLGGRLDAVNILDADVAIVTSIDLDHQDWLGDDRETIGKEKAGIFRPDKIAICVDPQPPKSLLNYANTVKAKLIDTSIVGWEVLEQQWQWRGVDSTGQPLIIENLPLSDLPVASLSAALQAVLFLGINLDKDALSALIRQLELPGRLQQFQIQGRQFILDVAHNPAAATNLANQLAVKKSNGQQGSTTHAIFGAMADKDIASMIQTMAGVVDHWYVSDLKHIARAATAETLSSRLSAEDIEATTYANVTNAVESALKSSRVGDRVLVFGSFYTVAEALQWRNKSLLDKNNV